MNKRNVDWKDIAESYYDKSVCLAILILFFAFIVSPEIEVKPYDRTINLFDTIDIPPDFDKKIELPKEIVKPVFEIIIDDGFDSDIDEDIPDIFTIDPTILDPLEIQKNILGSTKEWVYYEDAPFAIKTAPAEYTTFAKNVGMEGDVILRVEIFTDGSVGEIEMVKSLMSGPGGLDDVAVNSVRQWEFSPAKVGGKPVACWVTFSVKFSLN